MSLFLGGFPRGLASFTFQIGSEQREVCRVRIIQFPASEGFAGVVSHVGREAR